MSMPWKIGFGAAPGPHAVAGGVAVAGGTVTRVHAREPRRGFGVAPGRQIHRDGDDVAAGGFRALHHLRGDIEVVRRVELEPDRSAARLRHVLDGLRRLRGHDEQLVLRLRGASGPDFPVRMEGAGAADRTQEHGGGVLLAEELHRHVDAAHVHEAARPQLVAVESLAVGAQRHLAVHAAHQVAPVRGRHDLLRRSLEVEDVERVRGLREVALVHGLGQRRNERQQRAAGQKRQEGAAIGLHAHGL
jgi:hypothetical protein